TGFAGVLGCRQDRRDVVSGVGIIRRQEGVVVVEFTNGDPVGPGCPFGRNFVFHTKDRGTSPTGRGSVGGGLRTCRDDGFAVQRGDRHRGVIDDAVDDHVLDLVGHGNIVGGHLGDFVGQLVFVRQVLGGWVDAYFV